MSFAVPDDVAPDDSRAIYLSRSVTDDLMEARDEMLVDPRLEHLGSRRAEDELRRFVALCVLDRSVDHVEAFITRNASEVAHLRCFIPVLFLDVKDEFEIRGAVLLPLDHESLPRPDRLLDHPSCGGVVSVEVSGSNSMLMARRARRHAEHALRILRAGLRLQNQYHPRQLRFRLGETYAFDSDGVGWSMAEDTALGAPVSRQTVVEVQALPLADLSEAPTNELERHAALALAWINRSLLATEPLVTILFGFFALEAVLGDKAEGQKARSLVFRRTVLGHAVTGTFSSPMRLYDLYEEVRSAAVHGSEPPYVPSREAEQFQADVLATLNEYLTFANTHRITRRSKLHEALIQHADTEEVLQWLRDHDKRGRWNGYEPRRLSG